ncbi:MAG: phosphotransferase [Anaerolineae bacterium]|nr:phosphotransferase [Anaerolineae bacterium]
MGLTFEWDPAKASASSGSWTASNKMATLNPVAARMAAFLRAKHDVIDDLVTRAGRLAQVLQTCAAEAIVCHSDLHAGNFHICAGGDFYIVDWDDPILAPKERDLMAAGSGLMGGWRTPPEEEKLFYRGYGHTTVDPVALAYYRYERIVQDLAVYCEQIFLSDEGGPDREQSFRYLASNFLPGNTIAIADRADRTGIFAGSET